MVMVVIWLEKMEVVLERCGDDSGNVAMPADLFSLMMMMMMMKQQKGRLPEKLP